MQVKKCSTCKKNKSVFKFYLNRAINGYQTSCKKCQSIERTMWWRNNKHKTSEYRKKRREKLGAHHERWHYIHKKYGLTEKEYKKLLRKQNNKCLICGNTKGGKSRTKKEDEEFLRVDHCHITGLVRGLLCSKCNYAIGLLNDDPKLLVKASRYLERFNEKHPYAEIT